MRPSIVPKKRQHEEWWDTDVFELPREMLWDLPRSYLVSYYSKAPPQLFAPREPSLGGEVQDELDGVLDRMGEGHISTQDSWTSENLQEVNPIDE